MPLSCGYGDEDSSWFFIPPDDFTTFEGPKRKRCCSCKELIDIGALSLKFACHRPPKNEIEDRIYGEDGEIPLADKFLCEPCGDQFMNLEALGFCIDITENMIDLLKEYVENYGRKAA
jgi:hypothetical protein